MNEQSGDAQNPTWKKVVVSVLMFWIGYLLITFGVGFVTSLSISPEVWQLTAWGFISSIGLIALSWFLSRSDKGGRADLDWKVRPSSMGRLGVGLLIGAGSFAVHVLIISTFAGRIRFEWVPEVGVGIVLIYFARFLSTSCMEEIGFRGFALRRLSEKMGTWPVVCITTVFFGLSHLSYGWSLQTIALGVIPGGLLWGMSAVATRGLAVPIGLHAAWNFAGWTAGNRAETGLLQMIVEEDAIERTRMVGTASYWFTFGTLTIAFWLVHRRNVRNEAATLALAESER
ncbi:MAG: CPBP family intramembrane glutamic endopeptidase [Verrucomicrobiales bacterium]